MTVDAILVLHVLNSAAEELDKLADDLHRVEVQLEPVQQGYDDFLSAYEAGLWEQHVTAGAKFPPEKLRERMGRLAMPPEVLGEYVRLTNERRRLKDKIQVQKATVEARRSVLSALKEGLVS